MRMRDAKKLEQGDPVRVQWRNSFLSGVVADKMKPSPSGLSMRRDGKVGMISVHLENGEYIMATNYDICNEPPDESAREIYVKYHAARKEALLRAELEARKKQISKQGKALRIAKRITDYMTTKLGHTFLDDEVVGVATILLDEVEKAEMRKKA